MVKLRYQDDLLFTSLDLTINNETLKLANVLIDTGSATTLINADYIFLDGTEKILNVQGVGRYEKVLFKKIDNFQIDNFTLNDISICVGDMDYGINIDCILGLDILKALNANISIKDMTLTFDL